MTFNLRVTFTRKSLKVLAERTGLEPATPGVTGRYSNQLNYRSELRGPFEERRPLDPGAGGKNCHDRKPTPRNGARIVTE